MRQADWGNRSAWPESAYAVTAAKSWHEVPRREAQGTSKAQDQAELRICLASFGVLQGCPMDPGQLGKFVLREVSVHAGSANAVAQFDASFGDPWRRCGLHSLDSQRSRSFCLQDTSCFL